MFNVRLAGGHAPVWETAVHLAVACGVFYGVFCAVFFPLDVLHGIWDLIESVSEGLFTYSCHLFSRNV